MFKLKKIKVGDKAPDFKLKDKDSKEHSLSDIKTRYIVVYFYPKDNTPGCSIEADLFNKHLKDFAKLDTTIIGISGGDEKSKTKFCKKYELKFVLLSDSDFKVSKSYGCYGEKSFMGRRYMGIFRNTFLLDKDKKIIHIFEKVKPAKHTTELLDFIKNLETK